ncbi:MAG: hypothetical protein KatS3mg059_0635 [Thermomicrobiales bacterium]|nr:MAG: hypothetical protein KatS3mg059_0635 [Thermomicrobiales bacterium]
MSVPEATVPDRSDQPVRLVPLDATQDAAAAVILAPCAPDRSVAGGQHLLASARDDSRCEIYGLFAGNALAAVCVVKTIPFAKEIVALAVGKEWRGRGYGRACLTAVAAHSRQRPLTVEVAEDLAGFYRACGFRVVGKRRGPDGTVRYRLGWHAPRRAPGPQTDPQRGEIPA